jgi:hypothetical protein
MMPVRKLFSGLVLLALLTSALACSFPYWSEDRGTIVLPTAPPTLAPTPLASQFPLVFQASGHRTTYAVSSPVNASCQIPLPATLTIRAGGAAELSFTGPNFIDYYNCKSSGEETWFVNGKADLVNQTVTFESCNHGRFSASGTVKYAGGPPDGSVACFWKNGEKAVEMLLIR